MSSFRSFEKTQRCQLPGSNKNVQEDIKIRIMENYITVLPRLNILVTKHPVSAASCLRRRNTSSETLQKPNTRNIIFFQKSNSGFLNLNSSFYQALSQNCKTRLLASSYLSVRPSAQNTSAPPRRIFMKFHICVFFKNLPRKIKFHQNSTRLMGNLHENVCTFMVISS